MAIDETKEQRLESIYSKLVDGDIIYDIREFLNVSGCDTLEEVAESPITYNMFMECLPAMKVIAAYSMPEVLRQATYAKASMHALLMCKDMAE